MDTVEISTSMFEFLIKKPVSYIVSYIGDNPQALYKGIPLIFAVYNMVPIISGVWAWLPCVYKIYQYTGYIPYNKIYRFIRRRFQCSSWTL